MIVFTYIISTLYDALRVYNITRRNIEGVEAAAAILVVMYQMDVNYYHLTLFIGVHNRAVYARGVCD